MKLLFENWRRYLKEGGEKKKFLRFGDPQISWGGYSKIHDPKVGEDYEVLSIDDFMAGPAFQKYEEGISAYRVEEYSSDKVVFYAPVGVYTWARQAKGFLLERIIKQEIYVFEAVQVMVKKGYPPQPGPGAGPGEEQEYYDALESWGDPDEMVPGLGYDREPLIDASTVSSAERLAHNEVYIREGARGEKNIFDLISPSQIVNYHDMGYDEFFTKERLAELGLPSPITRETLNQYFDRLAILFRGRGQIKEIEGTRQTWLQQMDEDSIE
jgi:hypothetical protein